MIASYALQLYASSPTDGNIGQVIMFIKINIILVMHNYMLIKYSSPKKSELYADARLCNKGLAEPYRTSSLGKRTL